MSDDGTEFCSPPLTLRERIDRRFCDLLARRHPGTHWEIVRRQEDDKGETDDP
jgi:hypothetical protein